MKNIITKLLIFLTITTQSIFAAKMDIYNLTRLPINILVDTTKGMLPAKHIPVDSKASFDTGLFHAFKSITWIETNHPKTVYMCRTPSTKIMISGLIYLEQQSVNISLQPRFVTINFDDRGASSSKWGTITALERNLQ